MVARKPRERLGTGPTLVPKPAENARKLREPCERCRHVTRAPNPLNRAVSGALRADPRPACHAEGRGFESLHPLQATRWKRRVFCFRGGGNPARLWCGSALGSANCVADLGSATAHERRVTHFGSLPSAVINAGRSAKAGYEGAGRTRVLATDPSPPASEGQGRRRPTRHS
jgi:hypothetical protein